MLEKTPPVELTLCSRQSDEQAHTVGNAEYCGFSPTVQVCYFVSVWVHSL